jgi:hypothetical protein
MSALPVPSPIIKPEEPNPFSAVHSIHRAHADFWKEYRALPADIRDRADRQFALLRANPRHPSLQFKKLTERGGRELWSARVTLKYRALAVKLDDDYVWFWIGEHDAYEGTI